MAVMTSVRTSAIALESYRTIEIDSILKSGGIIGVMSMVGLLAMNMPRGQTICEIGLVIGKIFSTYQRGPKSPDGDAVVRKVTTDV